MLIIMEDQVPQLQGRYVTLELDRIRLGPDGPVKRAYCVVENIGLQDMPRLDNLRQQHQSVINNYHSQQWDQCLTTLADLQGQWNGELDSFYQDLKQHIDHLQAHPPGQDWDSAITKTPEQKPVT